LGSCSIDLQSFSLLLFGLVVVDSTRILTTLHILYLLLRLFKMKSYSGALLALAACANLVAAAPAEVQRRGMSVLLFASS